MNGFVRSLVGVGLLLLTWAPASGDSPPLFTTLLESFESNDLGGWKPLTEGLSAERRYAVAAELSPLFASTDGARSLRVSVDVPNGGGAAVFGVERPDQPISLGQASALTLDIYTPEPGLNIALSLSTGGDWEWFESLPVPVPPGWSKLTLPLTEGWKAARSGWQYTTGVANLQEIRRLALIAFTGRRLQASCYIDNIRSVRAAP